MTVIAPDKFKGTLTALEACRAIAAGLKDDDYMFFPMADGGEGTAEALDGVNTGRGYWILPDGNALVMSSEHTADRSLPLRMRTTERLGKAIVTALRETSRIVFVGIGGTATCDAGESMVEILDAQAGVTGRVVGLADVRATLCTPGTLSAMDFVAQKGGNDEDKKYFADKFNRLVERYGQGGEFAGAGGGIAWALDARFGCRVISGAEYVWHRIDPFFDSISRIITGEGKLDCQTAGGKVVDTVAKWAKRWGIECIGLFGQVEEYTTTPLSKVIQVTPPGIIPTHDQAAYFLTRAAAEL